MVRNRLIALPLLVALPFAAAACGGSDDPAEQAQKAVQSALDEQAEASGGSGGSVEDAVKKAQELSAGAVEKAREAAESVGDAPAADAMAGMAAFQQKFLEATAPIRQEAQAIQQRVSSGEIDAAEGEKQLAAISERMKKAISDLVTEMSRDGNLPEEAKQQLDAMAEQLQQQTAGQ